jgi:KDO2-lipid IV(A) lauroyltransferase
MLLASHYASWEWLITLNQKIGYHGVGVYKKLSNILISLLEIFDQNTTLSWLTPAKRFPISPNQKQGILSIYGLPSDQPKGKSDFHGIPLWVSKFQCIPALKCWQKI